MVGSSVRSAQGAARATTGISTGRGRGRGRRRARGRGRGQARARVSRGRRGRNDEEDSSWFLTLLRIQETELRHVIAEFAWSITTSSIPVFLLSNNTNVYSSKEMIANFNAFRWCSHSPVNQAPCISCAHILWTKSNKLINHIPSVCTLSCDIADPKDLRGCTPIGRNFEVVSFLLGAAVQTSSSFESSFRTKQSIEAKNYTNLYQILVTVSRLTMNLKSQNSSGADSNPQALLRTESISMPCSTNPHHVVSR